MVFYTHTHKTHVFFTIFKTLKNKSAIVLPLRDFTVHTWAHFSAFYIVNMFPDILSYY